MINQNNSLFSSITIDADSGIGAICRIIEHIENHFKADDPKYCCYPRPKVIFRGIDGIYDNTPTQEQHKHTIDSALCVRINRSYSNENENETYVKANYINGLLKLISDARKICPDTYKDMCDLHILADIQHHGGATCLVDFSKSMLLPLWFACNEAKNPFYQTDNGNHNQEYLDGYLYCYNYMHDLIMTNTLSVVHPDEEKKNIQDLVFGTYKIVDYCSDRSNRFRLWEPLAINKRIIRQDSVFIFGIEKFEPQNHNILSIKIPHRLKKDIRKALEAYFNISTATVFNDEEGLARANDKLTAFSDIGTSFSDRCYVDGFDCMIRGNYKEALELLTTYDLKKPITTSKPRRMELCFSLAVCYKNLADELSDNSLVYYRNAIEMYRRVIKLAKDVKEELGEEYFINKTIRAYNEIIDLQYKTQNFEQGTLYCEKAMNMIRSYNSKLNIESIYNKKKLDTKYLHFTKVEFLLLSLLSSLGKGYEDVRFNDFYTGYEKVKKTESDLNDFDKIILSFMCDIANEIWNCRHENKTPKTIMQVLDYVEAGKKVRKSKEIDASNYMEWDFSDLIEHIGKCKDLSYMTKSRILDKTSHVIYIRDTFNSQSRIVSRF